METPKNLDDIWPTASQIEIAKGRYILDRINLRSELDTWDAAIEWIKKYLEQASEREKQMGEKE